MPDHPPPERTEGPTPAGGAYALAYRRPDGSVEIVECDAGDRAIHRTYAVPGPPDRPQGPRPPPTRPAGRGAPRW